MSSLPHSNWFHKFTKIATWFFKQSLNSEHVLRFTGKFGPWFFPSKHFGRSQELCITGDGGLMAIFIPCHGSLESVKITETKQTARRKKQWTLDSTPSTNFQKSTGCYLVNSRISVCLLVFLNSLLIGDGHTRFYDGNPFNGYMNTGWCFQPI